MLLNRKHTKAFISSKAKELRPSWQCEGVADTDNQSFSKITSKGDKALFGGKSTGQMKQRLNVPKSRALADFLPAITIKAKDFANEITNFNIKRDDLHTENGITKEHIENNQEVRKLLVKRNIKPEQLPPSEDIKKVERRLLSEQKKLTTKAAPLEQPPKNKKKKVDL